MKRQPRNKQNNALNNSRSLRMESLEDRKLMTVAAEMVQMPLESQIGSEHWPEPAAEIAVEKVTNERQGFFSRGLHNNGAFRAPGGHILWTAKDNSDTSSDSYTDSGRVPYYAYELKNVQVVSVIGQPRFPALLATDHFSHHANVDKVFGENLGGQEGEALKDNDNQSSLNFEEIKVTYTQNDNVGKKRGRSSDLFGSTMYSARSSNDPIFFSHHANVDKVFGEHRLGGQEGEPLKDNANQISLNFEEIKVTYTQSDNAGEKRGRSNDLVDSTMHSAIGSTCRDPWAPLAANQISLNDEGVSGARTMDWTWQVEEGEAVAGWKVQEGEAVAGRKVEENPLAASFTPTTDLPDGDYYLQDTSETSNPKTLNFDLLGWT